MAEILMTQASRAASPGGSARRRMLSAAKTLFAEKGFESTSTATIARRAGSSESQLVKHFEGKQGLLAEIFNEGWEQVTEEVRRALPYAPTPGAKLGILAHGVITHLERDPELKKLFLLEGRRMRRGADITVTKGFLDFVALIDSLLEEMRAANLMIAEIHPQAVRSALMGMMEGMLRDRYLAETGGYPAHFGSTELPQMLSIVMACLMKKRED